MATYKNITPTEFLRSDAADSISRAVAHGGMPLEVNDGWRSLAEQENLFFKNYTSIYAASSKRDRRPYKGRNYWRRNPYYSHVAVAIPGTSNHGTGIAVDLGHAARAWMFKHGAYYGWTNPAWAKKKNTYEPWHWEYNPAKDKSKELWNDMPKLVKYGTGKDQSIKPGGWNTVKISDQGYVSLVVGAKSFDADVTVRIDGLKEGAQVQGRLYKVNYDAKTGKSERAYTYSDSMAEFIGTAGTTLFRFGNKGGCSPDQRVRAEIYVWGSPDAKIVEAHTRSHIW